MRRLGPVAVPEDTSGTLVRVPIMGAALCAGFPSPADDFIEDALELPRWLVPNPPATFLWRVRGSSMIQAGIHDGDLAVVDRSLDPVHHDVVVAVVDAEPSLKRYLAEKGRPPRLAFENMEMPAFPIEDIAGAEIWGVVPFTIRWHRLLRQVR